MERVRRRWWTWSVSIFAVLVILAAAVSSAFQLAVMELPSYRDQLSDWVTKVAGRPVDINGVSLVWRGIYPRLDLSGITLYSEDGEDEVLTADRLSLGFGLLRLATGDFTPALVELSGVSLAVNIDADGKVSIVGLDSQQNTPTDYQEWLRAVAHFKDVRLLDCDLQITAPQLPDSPLQVHLASAEAWRTFTGLAARAHLDLPPNYGKALDFNADIDGAVDQPGGWRGTLDARISNLQPQPWLRKWVLPGTRLGAGNAWLDLKGRLKSGHFEGFDLQLQTGTLLAGRGPRDTTVKSLNLLARATVAADGWQIDLRQFALDGQELARGGLHYAPLADGSGYDLGADADLLRLDHLTPWLAYWRDPPKLVTLASHMGGELDGAVLRVHHSDAAPEYSLRATLKGIGYNAGSGPAGFSGLNGEVSADENGGRLHLGGGTLTLDLPHEFRQPVTFDTLAGEAQWSRQSDGWQIGMPSFAWTLLGTGGQGQFGLLLPDAEDSSPQLDLSAHFSAEDVTRAKVLIPRTWGDGLEDWLTRAIVSARVPRGDLTIRGPLADFPYAEQQTGSWKLDLDVAGARLDYLPDWPGVEGLKARLAFRGNSLSIDADAGSISGTHIRKVSARIADFHQALLQIDGVVSGETARYYDFLRNSPLKKTLAGLVNNTSASGPAQVMLHLDIPLKQAAHTDVSGDVALDGVQLNYKGLRQPIEDIRGDIRFSPKGVSADHLSGRFEDLDLTASIAPRAGTEGVITAGFDFVPRMDGSGASAFIPELVRKVLSGSSHWAAELPLGGTDDGLTLSTDLQGVAVALPPPLGKRVDEIAPLIVMIGGGDPNALRVRVDYHDRLGAEIALAPGAAGWSASGVNLHLGPGFASSTVGKGVYVNGSVDDLDLGAWSAVLHEANSSGMPLQQADLHANRLLLMGQTLRDVHAVYTPNATGWTAKLDGAGAEGSLAWRDAGGVLEGRFKHLAIDAQAPPPESPPAALAASPPPAAAKPPTDPAQLPLLDLGSDQFRVGDASLGKLTLVTQRIDGGQKISNLQLTGGGTTLNAGGMWKRLNGQSSAALKFDLTSPDIAALLRAFGYAPNLDAKTSHFTGDLNWAPAAEGITWELARGPITVDVQNGKLKAVEPGAGRVLGLLNFYALPRRLTLDFRDVVSSGLGFDSIAGSFDLADGAAVTQNLDIAGPSLRMEVRGKVGLLARDFDEHVKVYPDVSSGITLGAALLGGPAVGALVLIAQQVLKTPLDKVTQLNYHVTGPWDNPKIE
ncbi:MAG: YhdP family protein [Stenotrophobium sp.]